MPTRVAVGAEQDVAAVVVRVRLVDREQDAAGGRVGAVAGARRGDWTMRVSPSAFVKLTKSGRSGEVGIEREAEQALLVALRDGLGQGQIGLAEPITMMRPAVLLDHEDAVVVGGEPTQTGRS